MPLRLALIAIVALAAMLCACSRSPKTVALDVTPLGHLTDVVLHFALAHDTVRNQVGIDPTVTITGNDRMSAKAGVLFWFPETGYMGNTYALAGDQGTGTLEIGLRLRNHVWHVEKMDLDGNSLLKDLKVGNSASQDGVAK